MVIVTDGFQAIGRRGKGSFSFDKKLIYGECTMGLGERFPRVCGKVAVVDLVGVDVMGLLGVVASVEPTNCQQTPEMREP